ncbi:unnamed protein product [Alopecurus aequalis]
MAAALRHAARRIGTQATAAPQRMSTELLEQMLPVDENKRDAAIRLLQIQVQPRQDDPRWRSYRRWAIFGECCKYAGGIYIGKLAGDGLVHVYQQVQHPSGK